MAGFRRAFAKFLSVQMLTLIFALTAFFMLTCAVLDIREDRQRMLADMERRAGELGGLLRLAVEKPLRLGDDRGTAAELARLAERYPELALSVAGFNGGVTYSTRPAEIRGRLEDLFPLEIAERYQAVLQGREIAGGLVEEGGRRKFLLLSSFENQPECYHCHGWSQPVIGAMAVLLDVEDEFSAFRLTGLGTILSAVFGAALLSLLLFLVIRIRFISRILALARTTAKISTLDGTDELAPEYGSGEVFKPEGRTERLEGGPTNWDGSARTWR